MRNPGSVDMLAPTAAVLVIGALASLNSSETNGVVATAVLGGDEPGAPLVNEGLGMVAEQPLSPQDPGGFPAYVL